MDVIRKPPPPRDPNLGNDDEARRHFSWPAARLALLAPPPPDHLNMAQVALDRHARSALADKVALRWLGKDGAVRDYSFARLAGLTSRFANVLAGLGIAPGDGVFLLCGRIPELHVALLGALKQRCVVTPLFSAFGPEPIATRLTLGAGRLLVTTSTLYRRKIEPMRRDLASLRHVLVVRDDEAPLPKARWTARVARRGEPALRHCSH